MKKRNFFAKKDDSSFLNLVQQITESVDDETEGLDFEDEGDDFESDDFESDEFDTEDEDFSSEEEMDDETVTISIPRSAAMTLIDALQAVIGETDEMDDLEDGGDDFESEDFDTEDDADVDMDADAEEFEEVESEEEDECDKDAEEDEEVLGSNQSNVAQSTISRDGAPKRSKANTTWNTGKIVKSVFNQTVSSEGEPAGVSRDGAPKRSKLTKGWNNSKTVSSRIQPGKHIMEIGK